MKTYTIDREKILESVKQEVSRVAASAYADDGTSLYDAIIITSRDADTIAGLIDDAETAVVVRMSDIASIQSDQFSFNVPDKRTHDIKTIGAVIDRFIEMNVCSAWMIQKYKLKAEEYGARSTDALNKIERLLYEKLPPEPPTHINN